MHDVWCSKIGFWILCIQVGIFQGRFSVYCGRAKGTGR